MCDMTFADKLRSEMVMAKMSVPELVEVSGASASTIYRYLNNESRPKKDTEYKILRALDAKKHALANDEADEASIHLKLEHWDKDDVKNLCVAIVKQAVDDYKKTLQGKKIINDHRHIQTQVYDCETFFRSEWFTWIMPDIDGEKLINAIREKYPREVEDADEPKARADAPLKKIDLLISEHQMTVREFCRSAAISTVTFYRFKQQNGKNNSSETISKIAAGLNVPVEAILEDEL